MATEQAAENCLGCKGPLQSLGEGILDMELLACRNCRRVELRVPQQR